jgi:acyl carrier protein
MTRIEEQVIKVITKELRLKAGTVTLESKFREDLGTDSLDALEIVVALEDAFHMEMPTTTHEKIITVKDAVDAVLEFTKKR